MVFPRVAKDAAAVTKHRMKPNFNLNWDSNRSCFCLLAASNHCLFSRAPLNQILNWASGRRPNSKQNGKIKFTSHCGPNWNLDCVTTTGRGASISLYQSGSPLTPPQFCNFFIVSTWEKSTWHRRRRRRRRDVEMMRNFSLIPSGVYFLVSFNWCNQLLQTMRTKSRWRLLLFFGFTKSRSEIYLPET